jgi:cardiolipin synthase
LLRSHQKAKQQAFELHVSPAPGADGFALALYQSLGVRLAAGHRIGFLPNGTVFDALVEQIQAAKSSINIGIYIWERGQASDRVIGALVARARAGVRCRILVDDVGSPDFEEKVAAPLRQAGCDVRVFRPLSGNEKLARSHRKLVIIDGTSAITGGFGIRDTWLGDGVHGDSWRDSNVAFSGPAVSGAQQAFAENWQEAGGELLPAADFPEPTATGSIPAAFVGSTQGVITRAERLTQLMMVTAKRVKAWTCASSPPTRTATPRRPSVRSTPNTAPS